MTSEASRPASAGRPRSEQAHRAILDATLELLGEVGFSALTVEGIATRAGVGKATIYRRWSSKLPLVIEAFRGLPGLEDPDTGSIEGDLREMLLRYVRNLTSTPLAAVLSSLAGERAHDADLSAYFDPLLVERRQPLVRVLRRAVERGELPQGLDVEFAADLVVGPLSTRFMWGAGVSERIVEPTVRMALWGLKRAAATPDEHTAEPRSD